MQAQILLICPISRILPKAKFGTSRINWKWKWISSRRIRGRLFHFYIHLYLANYKIFGTNGWPLSTYSRLNFRDFSIKLKRWSPEMLEGHFVLNARIVVHPQRTQDWQKSHQEIQKSFKSAVTSWKMLSQVQNWHLLNSMLPGADIARYA